MALSSLGKLPELKIDSQGMNFVSAHYQELKIDILLAQNPLFKKVLRKYIKIEPLFERDIPLATVEGLLLLKLYSLPSLYRQGNFARVGIYENDIASLVQHYQPDSDLLLNKLAKFVSESDLAEINHVMIDIQQHINRFHNGSNPLPK
jgi:hypothetical protein